MIPEIHNDLVKYKEVAGSIGYRVGTDGSAWTRWEKKGFGTGGGRGAHHFVGRTWKKLKVIKSTKGYGLVTFRGKQKRLGRVILETFIGPCPLGMQCCHKDDNGMNNSLSNLRWGTPKSNAADRDRNGGTAKGERIASARFTEADVREMYALKAIGWSQVSIAEKFSTVKTVIWGILHGHSWKHIHKEIIDLRVPE